MTDLRELLSRLDELRAKADLCSDLREPDLLEYLGALRRSYATTIRPALAACIQQQESIPVRPYDPRPMD